MSPEVVNALVHLVASAKRLRVDEAATINRLIDMGVPKEHAAELLSDIRSGLDQGANVASLGFGERPTSPPASPLFVAAFAEGHRTVHEEKRWAGHIKFIIFVVAAVVCLLIYYFSR
jgi:VIT1/CCC1 family predicted Fe2+/Mn2+ transporter